MAGRAEQAEGKRDSAPLQRGGSLLWRVESEELVRPRPPSASTDSTDTAAPPPPPPRLSLVDRIAAPSAFMHQSLIFAAPLDAARLRSALAEALALFPSLACRATQDEVRCPQPCCGHPICSKFRFCVNTPGCTNAPTQGPATIPFELGAWSSLQTAQLQAQPPPGCLPAQPQDGDWRLCRPGAGARLAVGSSDVPLHRLVLQSPPQPAAALVDLGSELFGHLPFLGGDPGGPEATPLVEVALVALQGGGACLLGLRMSHLVGDFGSLRALMHHLAAAYSGRALDPSAAPAPGEPFVTALASAPPPPSSRPYNYLSKPPGFDVLLGRLASAPPLHGLTLYFPPERLAALKARAAAEAEQAARGDGSGDGSPAWVSTNDALMAWLWKALAAMPCRGGAVTAFNQALDMRGRLALPAAGATAAAQGQQQQQQPWLYGNLATSAYTNELDVAAMPLGAVALALRRTVVRCARGLGQGLGLPQGRPAVNAPRGTPTLPLLGSSAPSRRHLPHAPHACSAAEEFGPDVAQVAAAVAGGAEPSSFVILPFLRIVQASWFSPGVPGVTPCCWHPLSRPLPSLVSLPCFCQKPAARHPDGASCCVPGRPCAGGLRGPPAAPAGQPVRRRLGRGCRLWGAAASVGSHHLWSHDYQRWPRTAGHACRRRGPAGALVAAREGGGGAGCGGQSGGGGRGVTVAEQHSTCLHCQCR